MDKTKLNFLYFNTTDCLLVSKQTLTHVSNDSLTTLLPERDSVKKKTWY